MLKTQLYVGCLLVSLCVMLVACNLQRSRQTPAYKPLKILLISDLNDAYGSLDYSGEVQDLVRQLPQIQPDMILCAGDMVAGQKASLSRGRLDSMWNGFYKYVLEPTSVQGIPFAFTMGNHDASPNFHKDRAAAQDFWLAHAEDTHLDFVDKTHYPFWFSYRQGDMFFISWDASASRVPQEVMTWMQQQLQTQEARQAHMRIVLGHLPLYALVEAKNTAGEVNANADAALDFFKTNGVDLYISGHQHAYFPGRKAGVNLLNLGCLGGGPRPLIGDDRPGIKTYSILEFNVDKSLKISTVDAVTKAQIPLEVLPDTVQGFNGTLWRMDLRPPKPL